MKLKINKLLTLCTAFCLLLTGAITGLAEEAGTQQPNQGVITLHTGSADVTNTSFDAYKVFNITTDGTNVSYIINSDFQEFFNDKLKLELADNDAAYNLVKGSASNLDFQKNLKEYIIQKNVAKKEFTKVEGQNKFELSNLEYGYYVVVPNKVDGETQLTLIFTTLYENNQVVYIKGVQPGVDKKVNGNEWASAQIGDTVNFTVESVVPNMVDANEYHYSFTDTMSEGLTLTAANLGLTIKIGEEPVTADKYELIIDETNRTFSVKFNNFIDYKNKANEKISFSYSAVLNENALSTNPATNSASIQYGNDPVDLPVAGSDSVKVFTHNLVITKVDAVDNSKKLQGATFELYKVDGEKKTQLNFVLSNGKYIVSKEDTAKPSIVTDTTGLINVEGLNVGDYELIETKAPNGYNILKNPITFTITATSNDGGVTVTTENNKLEVKNNAGTLLPETGGMGTVMFTVVGVVGILAVAYSFRPKKNK